MYAWASVAHLLYPFRIFAFCSELNTEGRQFNEMGYWKSGWSEIACTRIFSVWIKNPKVRRTSLKSRPWARVTVIEGGVVHWAAVRGDGWVNVGQAEGSPGDMFLDQSELSAFITFLPFPSLKIILVLKLLSTERETTYLIGSFILDGQLAALMAVTNSWAFVLPKQRDSMSAVSMVTWGMRKHVISLFKMQLVLTVQRSPKFDTPGLVIVSSNVHAHYYVPKWTVE